MESVKMLMKEVDRYVQQPIRLNNAPFLMSIEGIFVATGRGTVLTGKVETGTVKLTDVLELVGGREILNTFLHGFRNV